MAAVTKPAKTPAFALDEDLWFGHGDDVEAESRAAASLAAVGARIMGAKPFPIAARRLDELTRSNTSRIEQVVSVLESDPALSARLLRLVNSAGYGLKIRCTSVRHAAVLVGSRRLNQVATTAAILDLFDANNERAVELLEHAAVVGSLCRYLAVHVGLPHDEMFTCGFLHDIGKLMLLDAEREAYADLLAAYSGAPDQTHLEERRVFGFDHAVLGAHVLAAWNIPDPVPKVIAWHHNPARAMQDTVLAAMVETLRLADLISYVLALHDERVGIEIVANSEAARYLDISDVQLAAMWADLAALRERSRARSHGQPEIEVMVPKSDSVESLKPRSGRMSRPSGAVRAARATVSPNGASVASPAASKPLQEVPAHFPCSVCAKPSYGNRCLACAGHVCPEHQNASDEWCSTCRREFVHFRKTAELSLPVKIGAGALVGGTLAAGVVGAAHGSQGLAGWIIAPVVVLALWAVVLPVAYHLWQKLCFLRSRRQPMPGDGQSMARPAPTTYASLSPEIDEEREDSSGTTSSAPHLALGPISTTSISLSMAPRSGVSRSMAPRSSMPLSIAPPAAAPEPTSIASSRSSLRAATVASVAPSSVFSRAPSSAPSGAPDEVPPSDSPASVRSEPTTRAPESGPRISIAPSIQPQIPPRRISMRTVAEPEETPVAPLHSELEQVQAAANDKAPEQLVSTDGETDPSRADPVASRPLVRPRPVSNSALAPTLAIRCAPVVSRACSGSFVANDPSDATSMAAAG